jgi:hypothetical protein
MSKNVLAVSCFCAILLLALMTACGGSSSTSTTPPPPTSETVTGVFADDPVVGLSYTCGTNTQAATTDADGKFTCPTGSTVTFKVGGVTLCTGPAQAFMTPVSCAQIADPTATTSTESVVRIARFLQSISTTPASSGKLTITAAELTAAANVTLDFATATDTELQAAVSAINPGATLVDATTAEAQLLTTVNAGVAGTYIGTFTSTTQGYNISGTVSLTIKADGSVTGTATPTTPSGLNPASVAGSLASGTTFTGTAGETGTWTGTLDTSKSPAELSGPWRDDHGSGTFKVTKQ